jgi:hypothetical protein
VVKGSRHVRLATLPPFVSRLSRRCWSLNSHTYGPSQPVTGMALPLQISQNHGPIMCRRSFPYLMSVCLASGIVVRTLSSCLVFTSYFFFPANSSSTFYSGVKHFETLSGVLKIIVKFMPVKSLGQQRTMFRHTLTATDCRLIRMLFEHESFN